MTDSFVSQVDFRDKRSLEAVDKLLSEEGLHRETHLDYICAMFDEDGCAVATGSCAGNTLRCFAVNRSRQGEGLLNQVLSHLITVQAARGNTRLFLYTKPDTARFFGDLGFYEIARVSDKLVFMENRRGGFESYLMGLGEPADAGISAAVVMNANPFTLGHQYLVEQASASCDTLHLFVVSEDVSLFPFAVRRRLVAEGVQHLPNVILHDCGPYIISQATFPSYFLLDEEAVSEVQARLDLTIFCRIAKALNISERWVGEEPSSTITRLYNRVMAEELPRFGIECHEIPRKMANNTVISASIVRQCIQKGDLSSLSQLVPQTTLDYLRSPEAILCFAIDRKTAARQVYELGYRSISIF